MSARGWPPTQEEVVGVWSGPSYPKYLDQVVKLSMNVTDYGDWRSDVHNIALPHQDFLGLFAYFSNKSFS